MNSQNPISVCYRKYFDFKGRASKSEFWSFFLFLTVVGSVLVLLFSVILASVEVTGWVLLLFIILNFFPYITVIARRLHDFGRSGWIQCIFLIIGGWTDDFLGTGEVIRWITMIIFCIYISQKPTPGKNKFGDAPKN